MPCRYTYQGKAHAREVLRGIAAVALAVGSCFTLNKLVGGLVHASYPMHVPEVEERGLRGKPLRGCPRICDVVAPYGFAVRVILINSPPISLRLDF